MVLEFFNITISQSFLRLDSAKLSFAPLSICKLLKFHFSFDPSGSRAINIIKRARLLPRFINEIKCVKRWFKWANYEQIFNKHQLVFSSDIFMQTWVKLIHGSVAAADEIVLVFRASISDSKKKSRLEFWKFHKFSSSYCINGRLVAVEHKKIVIRCLQRCWRFVIVDFFFIYK